MARELAIVEASGLTTEEESNLSTEIDCYIARQKTNRQEINRLVFACTAAMTEADDATAELASKGFLQSIIGEISGSNKKIQDQINQQRATAQWTCQQLLQRLAEQNLLSFELITAVNNKLNARMETAEAEFTNIYSGLEKFLRHNRNVLVRMDQRIAKLERKVDVLEWVNTVEYQEYEGEEYQDLTPARKITCLVHDFYQLTHGKWSPHDLLLLKNAMNAVGLDPDNQLSYADIIMEISADNHLLQHLLSGEFAATPDPQELMTLGAMYKYQKLGGDEKYLVDMAADMMGMENDKLQIRQNMLKKYMEQQANVRIDQHIGCFDLVIELLYSLVQANDEKLLAIAAPENRIEDDILTQAENLYARYKLAEAFPLFEKAGESGNGRALYFLGNYYKSGYPPVSQSEEKSRQYWQKSAATGEILAKVALDGCQIKEDEKRQLQEKVAEDVMAAVAYFDNFYNPDTLRKNSVTIDALHMAAGRGNWEAMKRLVHYYGEDKGIVWAEKLGMLGCADGYFKLGTNAENYEDAEVLLRKGYDLGDRASGSCAADIAYIYFLQSRENEAFQWAQKAAELNDFMGFFYLGHCYRCGTGTEPDIGKAISYYAKAYELNPQDGRPAYELGEIFANESHQPERAFSWYQKGAEAGEERAMVSLALCYRYGDGTGENPEEAFYWFQKAVETNAEDRDAIYFLAQCYEYGIGIDEDESKAYSLYERSAALEEPYSMFKMGQKYRENKNYKKALAMLQKAADQGVSDAYNILGILYDNGQGVKKNAGKAVELFGKAAEMNSSWGAYNLAQCYETGDGIQQDDAKALEWYAEAGKRGIDEARHKIAQIIFTADVLAELLSVLVHGKLKNGRALWPEVGDETWTFKYKPWDDDNEIGELFNSNMINEAIFKCITDCGEWVIGSATESNIISQFEYIVFTDKAVYFQDDNMSAYCRDYSTIEDVVTISNDNFQIVQNNGEIFDVPGAAHWNEKLGRHNIRLFLLVVAKVFGNCQYEFTDQELAKLDVATLESLNGRSVLHYL